MKPDAAARKAELAKNPNSATVVVTSDDDAFLNKSLGIEEEDEINPETGEYVESSGGDGKDLEVSPEEISSLEEKMGRKLTEEEITELSNIKKEEAEKGEELEIPEDFTLIKPENLPKELQPHFKRMLASFTKKMQGISEVNRKAELFDYFTENPEMARRMLAGDTTVAVPKGKTTDDVSEAEDSFVEQLNLPEDNELTPAIKAMAKLMVKGFGEVKTDKVKSEESKIKDGIKDYFDKNPTLSQDKELCMMMDRLGMENPSLYRNMPRLRKFAEAELGRPAKVATEQAKTNLAKLYKSMKEAKKASVSKPSVSAEKGATAKTKNIEEAFERALTRVRLKYGKK